MPMAKRLKLSFGQEEVDKCAGDENGSSVPVLIKLEPGTGLSNDVLDSTENGSIPPATSEIIIKSENEPTSLSKDTIPFLHDGVALYDVEKDACKRARSKSLAEAVTDFKVKEEPIKPVRISERLSIKRNRLGDAEESDSQALPPAQPAPKKQKTSASSNAVSKQQKKAAVAAAAKRGKKKKTFTKWSAQEMKLFFMYVGEYGKNFEAISKKISYMARIKGFPEKNKMQIRYFYYRCWTKVSKFIRMHQNGGAKRVPQELYCLINYGALRKHVKETDSQFSHCLNELIRYGETTYSSRGGKNKRCAKIKTPTCTYLKKLNKLEEEKRLSDATAYKLPSHVTLELTPKNSAAWAKVQEMSQNPRIRFKLSSNRTLESVFKYLNSKWKPQRVRLREALGDTSGEICQDQLVFHLHPSSKVMPFTMKPVESKKVDIAFKNYMEKILPDLLKIEKCEQNDSDQTDGPSNSESQAEEEMGQEAKSEKKEETAVVSETDTVGDENSKVKPDSENSSLKNSVSLRDSPDVIDCTSQSNVKYLKTEKKGESVDTETISVTLSSSLNETNCTSSSVLSSSSTPSSCLSLATSNSVVLPSSSLCATSILTQTLSSTKSVVEVSSLSQASISSPSSPLVPVTSPSSPVVPITSNNISSPLRSLTAALNLKPVSSQPLESSSSTTSSSTSFHSTYQISTLSALPALGSPSSNKKKINKTLSKKNSVSIANICDNYPNRTDLFLNEKNTSTSAESVGDLEEEVEKEMKRLNDLASSGFSISNSNTVTLLHLSLLLGRASVIRLEYEWKEKESSNPQTTPAFCSSSNQITNVLRRLCHIAALELAGFQMNNKSSMNSKGSNKSESSEGANKKDDFPKSTICRTKKKDGVRSIATMTDFRMTIPAKAIPFAPAKIIHHTTSDMGTTSTIQLKGTESVFRVPLVPTLHSVLSKEQEHKLQMQHEQAKAIMLNGTESVFRVPLVPTLRPVLSKEQEQKLQQQAKAIMQEQHAPRSRLLKRRSLPNRKGKQPPIIVQRTLLPKPGVHPSPVVVSMSPQIPNSPTLIQAPNTPTLALPTNSPTTSTWAVNGQLSSGTNILELAVKSAKIEVSPENSVSSMTDLIDVESNLTSSQATPLLSSPTPHALALPIKSSPPLIDQADISISDLDLSLTSTSASNVGPDAGDKFLDSMQERSQQGFAGLINRVSKENNDQEHPLHICTSLSDFNISSSSISSSSDKLGLPDQSWMAGESADVSLSSILGEFSSFQGKQKPQLKTPVKASISNTSFFDQSSSDAVDRLVTVSIPQSSFVSDATLNSLLGDPSLSSPTLPPKNGSPNEPDSSESINRLVAPPLPLFSEASQDSLAKLDVDVTLQGMVNESSVDLVTKFEKLAAQMAEQRQDLEASRLNTPTKQPGTDVTRDNTAI